MAQSHRCARRVDLGNGGPVVVAFDEPRVVHAHPVDRRVEPLDVSGALQAEDQCVHVRVHVPHGAAWPEPAGVADGRRELHPPEEMPADVLVKALVQELPDDLVRQVHGDSIREGLVTTVTRLLFGYACDQICEVRLTLW